MKAINIKLASFTFAAMLLASCSDSNDIIGGGNVEPNVVGKEVTSITDAQELAARVMNFKNGVRSRAAGATSTELGDVYSMPAKPSVPADAIEIVENYSAQGLKANTSYVIKKGTTITSGLNGYGTTTIYVEGTLNITNAYGSWDGQNTKNAKVVVLGGTVNVSTDSNQGEVFKSSRAKFYNYGGKFTFTNTNNQTNAFLLASGEEFYTDSDLDLAGHPLVVQGKLYVGGNATISSLEPKKGGIINIQGKINGLDGKDVYGFENKGLDGIVNVGGPFKCKNILFGNECKFYACSLEAEETAELNANGVELHVNHIKAKNINHYAGSKIFMVNNSVIECDTYKASNNGNGSHVTLEGDNAKAVFKANHIQFNGSTTTDVYMFNATGKSSAIYLDCPSYDFIGHPNQGEDVYGQRYDQLTWHGNAEKYDATNANLALDGSKTECGYIIGPSTPDTPVTPPGKKIDVVGEITYDHTHDISATCIQPYNGKMYMSYHTRGEGHGACIEVFETKNKQTQLLQYLQDKEKALDFNHLMVDPNNGNPQVYVVGNSFKSGAMLARIGIKTDGKLNTEVQEIDENTAINPLTVVPLIRNVKKGSTEASYDENAIVRDGDKLLIMSTRGYEVYDANTLTQLGNKEQPGKAKHIINTGNELATLYYTSRPDNVEAEVAGKLELFNTGQDILTANAKTSIDIASIAPNNGKNTIAIDGNNIYVCRSEKGLTCYNKATGAEVWTWNPPTAANTGKPLGYANGVTFDENYIYLACGGYGLVVLDKNKMTAENKPTVVAKKRAEAVKTTENGVTKESYNSANYVTLAKDQTTNDTYIYVAYGKSRLQVYQLVDGGVGDTDSSYTTK